MGLSEQELKNRLAGAQGDPIFEIGRAQKRATIQVQPGIEQTVLSCFAFPNCDAYIQANGDARALNATVRLYAIASGIKTLEASATYANPAVGLRVSAAGRGCESWELTIQTAVGVGAPTVPWFSSIVSFVGTATSASTSSSNGTPPGTPTFLRQTGSSGVIKNSSGNLLQVYGGSVTMGGANRWLQIFDANALPADGAAPAVPAIPLTGPNIPFSLDLTDPSDPPNAPGRLFNTGIVWCVSSTALVKTIDVASTFDVGSKFL